jgi:hypothetical protein
MTAIEALQELARRWARVNGCKSDDLLGGGRLTQAKARHRDALCQVARRLTGARDNLLADAFGMTTRRVMQARRRHRNRTRLLPMAATLTESVARGVASDERFADVLRAAVATEERRRTARAHRACADALTIAGQRPPFEIGRLTALRRFFDQGGRAALIERNRARTRARTESASA